MIGGKISRGYCKDSFTYKSVKYYQCTNSGPLGKDQYGGHGWCFYKDTGMGWVGAWDWCPAGCKLKTFI